MSLGLDQSISRESCHTLSERPKGIPAVHCKGLCPALAFRYPLEWEGVRGFTPLDGATVLVWLNDSSTPSQCHMLFI